MKKDIHPDYRFVVFKDTGADFAILTRSTAKSNETIKWEDGQVYPLIRLEISSASHPFFTGQQKLIDTAGRIEKFKKKYKDNVVSKGKKKPVKVRAKKEEKAKVIKK
ncbi:MAG: 50S ribosomal protein L31 [Candidatus Omnitrophica bacterium CG11_big_fil_rev_8_21_14_0_20_45_26]|uniref:Large ribosomal subunit protein bL31B n=1 Tax=Candidatus Abzuiibacterium crystallinum TaxID=1974748 RepID=A0A2H0LPB8_9BACT|nr:MAG: 50S ribosomal protein L31 [Candidatus Omnitrophica bacterium CG11_big_fil_rev_8_21_14_0_20_45_26]PIW63714.1 MAG: 50S ribosomal protein L31 [Candidatus Omnitrophica bacterium CG12_big_fil_rev_8_21_14_0_65_45_16]